jgi:hypothetical protein
VLHIQIIRGWYHKAIWGCSTCSHTQRIPITEQISFGRMYKRRVYVQGCSLLTHVANCVGGEICRAEKTQASFPISKLYPFLKDVDFECRYWRRHAVCVVIQHFRESDGAIEDVWRWQHFYPVWESWQRRGGGRGGILACRLWKFSNPFLYIAGRIGLSLESYMIYVLCWSFFCRHLHKT